MPVKPGTHKTQKKGFVDPRKDQRRGNSAERGYDHKWRKVRMAYIRRNPLCEHCLVRGKYVAVFDVDHIVPLSKGGARLDPNNLQSLCRPCHNRKTHGGGQ